MHILNTVLFDYWCCPLNTWGDRPARESITLLCFTYDVIWGINNINSTYGFVLSMKLNSLNW